MSAAFVIESLPSSSPPLSVERTELSIQVQSDETNKHIPALPTQTGLAANTAGHGVDDADHLSSDDEPESPDLVYVIHANIGVYVSEQGSYSQRDDDSTWRPIAMRQKGSSACITPDHYPVSLTDGTILGWVLVRDTFRVSRIVKSIAAITKGVVRAVRVGMTVYQLVSADERLTAAIIEFRRIVLHAAGIGGTKGKSRKGPAKAKRPSAKPQLVFPRNRTGVVTVQRPMSRTPLDKYLRALNHPFDDSSIGVMGPGAMSQSVPKHYHFRGVINSPSGSTGSVCAFIPHPMLTTYGDVTQMGISGNSLTAYTANPNFGYLETFSQLSADYSAYKVEACGVRFRSLIPSSTAPVTIDMIKSPMHNSLILSADVLQSSLVAGNTTFAGDIIGITVAGGGNMLANRGAVNFTTSDIYQSALEVVLRPLNPAAFQYQACKTTTGYHSTSTTYYSDQGFTANLGLTGVGTSTNVSSLFNTHGWESLAICQNNSSGNTNIMEFEFILHISGIPLVGSTAYPGTSGGSAFGYVSQDGAMGASNGPGFSFLQSGFGLAKDLAKRSGLTGSDVVRGLRATMSAVNYRRGHPQYTSSGRAIREL